jgi:hypothetical protein
MIIDAVIPRLAILLNDQVEQVRLIHAGGDVKLGPRVRRVQLRQSQIPRRRLRFFALAHAQCAIAAARVNRFLAAMDGEDLPAGRPPVAPVQPLPFAGRSDADEIIRGRGAVRLGCAGAQAEGHVAGKNVCGSPRTCPALPHQNAEIDRRPFSADLHLARGVAGREIQGLPGRREGRVSADGHD